MTTFKDIASKYNEQNVKGLEEITYKMVELWCSDGYREPNNKDNCKKKTISTKTKKDVSASPAVSSVSSSSTTAASSSSKCTESNPNEGLTCARQANYDYSDYNTPSVNELAAYFEDGLFFPKKMSFMAERMYI